MNPHKMRSRIEFQCNACQCKLERRISRKENMLIFAGSIAMVTALSLSILQIQTPLTVILYTLSILTGLIELRNELVKQRFFVIPGA